MTAAKRVEAVLAASEHLEGEIDLSRTGDDDGLWFRRTREVPRNSCAGKKNGRHEAYTHWTCVPVMTLSVMNFARTCRRGGNAYGLLLGNFKAYAQSTAKGGVRGCGRRHRSNYFRHAPDRLSRRRRHFGNALSYQITREFTFLPTRRSRVHARRSPARYRSVLRTARSVVRPLGFVRVDITLYNPARKRTKS